MYELVVIFFLLFCFLAFACVASFGLVGPVLDGSGLIVYFSQYFILFLFHFILKKLDFPQTKRRRHTISFKFDDKFVLKQFFCSQLRWI